MEKSLIIGKNINKIRLSKKLTLNVLSERSGVSKAMLSQIESNKVNPTVATVWKIAQGLAVDLNDLISHADEINKTFMVTKDSKHSQINDKQNKVFIKVLSPISLVEDLEIYMVKFDIDGILDSEPHYKGAEEFLTVLKGSVEVKAEDNVSILKKGDTILYDSDISHCIKNINKGESLIHMVVRFNKFKKI